MGGKDLDPQTDHAAEIRGMAAAAEVVPADVGDDRCGAGGVFRGEAVVADDQVAGRS